MHIFVDESGDCGMRRKTSSEYFAVAAVLIPTLEAISAYEAVIRETRSSLGFPEDYEFHFARIKDRHRRVFLARVAKCDFTFVTCFLNKADTIESEWRDKKYFYGKVLGAVAEAATDVLAVAQQQQLQPLKAKLVADDNNDPVYVKVLRERFRELKHDGKSLVGKIGCGRSRSSPMLQLADMICGSAVRWHLGEKEYLELVAVRQGRVIRLLDENDVNPR